MNLRNKKTLSFDQKPSKQLSVKSQEDTQYNQFTQETSNFSESYIPPQIIGRESQTKIINDFILDCTLSKSTHKILYISGVPGLGKTMLTLKIFNAMPKSTKQIKVVYINAIKLRKANHIYEVMIKQLGGVEKKYQKEIIINLESKLNKLTKHHFFIIDQVDYIMTNDQTIFYNLFQWANYLSKFNLILIGNTIDFPEKLQQKIQSRMGHNRLVFKPYTQQQIHRIVKQRLQNNHNFTAPAINFACKKMCTMSSDLRKILNVLKKSQQLYPQTQISIQKISQLWTKMMGNQQEWRQRLPIIYQKIINFISQMGGMTDSEKILYSINNKNNYHIKEIQHGLRQMNQMGIIKLQIKKQNSMELIKVHLLKS